MGARRDHTSRGSNPSSGGAGDRRGACRHAVLNEDASLGWWQNANFTSTPCRIIDISVNGFRVASQRHPGVKEGQSVWLHPQGLSPDSWTEGIVVSIRKPFLRECQVRIKLLTPFPYDWFKMLVHGADHVRVVRRVETPEHETDQFWK